VNHWTFGWWLYVKSAESFHLCASANIGPFLKWLITGKHQNNPSAIHFLAPKWECWLSLDAECVVTHALEMQFVLFVPVKQFQFCNICFNTLFTLNLPFLNSEMSWKLIKQRNGWVLIVEWVVTGKNDDHYSIFSLTEQNGGFEKNQKSRDGWRPIGACRQSDRQTNRYTHKLRPK
jgi:hypothetical protein